MTAFAAALGLSPERTAGLLARIASISGGPNAIDLYLGELLEACVQARLNAWKCRVCGFLNQGMVDAPP